MRLEIVSQPHLRRLKMNNCILLALRFRRLGVSRKVNNEDAGVQEEMLRVSKTILESPILDKIASYDRATKMEINSLAVPGTTEFTTLILPQDHIARAIDYLNLRTGTRAELVDEFLADYSRAKADAQMKLGNHYNPADYPHQDRVAAQFSMTWNTHDLGVPVVMSQIDPQLYEQERQRYCQEWERIIVEATEALASEFHGLLSHIIERLTPGEDGRPRIFRDSTVEHFRDFLEKFQPRNISNSESLATLARECQLIMATLGGNAANELRRSTSTRELIVNGMSRVRDSLSRAITTTAPRRYVRPIAQRELARCA
jgi:hypothetical protein